MSKNELKIAIRFLLKFKTYSLINILSLAVGLACCILILLFVQHEWSYDRFHENGERIYRLITAQKAPDGNLKKVAIQPFPMRDALLQEYSEIEHVARFIGEPRAIVRYSEHTFEEYIWFSDADVLHMFTFPLIAGNANTVLQNPNALVISQSIAKKYFGGENPLGKSITIRMSEQNYEFAVTGVIADIPDNSSIRFDFLIPFTGYPRLKNPHFAANWNSSQTRLFVALAKNANADDLESKLPALVKKYLGERVASNQREGSLSQDEDAWQLLLQPLKDVHTTPEIRWGTQPTGNPLYSYILIAIALLVLVIACINFTSLAVGRSAARAREVGMRKVLGANRLRLIKQFWSEAILLTLLALILGIGVAELFLPTFNSLVGKNLTLFAAGNWQAWTGLFGLLMAVGLVAGSYPALVLSGFHPVQALKNMPSISESKTGTRNRLRQSLVVVQYALSVLFVVVTLVMYDQLHYINNKDLGFDKEAVLAINAYSRDQESVQLLDRYRNALKNHSQVLEVSGCTISFGQGWSRQRWISEEKLRQVYDFRVDHNFAKTVGLQLVEGRFFSNDLPGDVTNAVVVNEALVREYGWQEPIVGRTLDGWGTNIVGADHDPVVIGVVKDYHFSSLHEAIQPEVLHLSSDWPIIHILVRIDPQNIAGAIAVLRQTWHDVHPNAPFEYTFIDEDINNQYLAEQRWSKLLLYSAIFAIVIASMGLFGLALLNIRQRTKEIGIRKVLGATIPNVTALLSKDFVKLVLLASRFACPVAWIAMNKWLQNFAYRIEIGWWVFALAGGLAFIIALVTVSTQAIRAALANPVESLRYE
ncbi:MAG: ABC transporter permease [bacterium]